MKHSNKFSLIIQSSVFVAIIWLIFDFIQSNRVDTEQHHLRTNFLLSTKSIDAQLDQFALQILAADLRQYDELVTLNQQLDQLSSNKEVGNSPFFNTNPDIQAQLSAYISLLEEKMVLMEQLKTSAALIRNALLYLPQLNQELDSLLGHQLVNDVIAYSFYADQSKYGSIQSKLALLDSNHTLQANLRQHLQAHLQQQEHLLNLKQQFINVDSKQAFSQLSDSYTLYHQQQIRATTLATQNALALCGILILLLLITLRLFNRAKSSELKTARILQAALSAIQEGFCTIRQGQPLNTGKQ